MDRKKNSYPDKQTANFDKSEQDFLDMQYMTKNDLTRLQGSGPAYFPRLLKLWVHPVKSKL